MTSTRRAPCPQCRRRRQRLRARSPLLNTLCMPVTRWAFTAPTVAALYASLTTPAIVAGAIAFTAWRYR